MAVSLPRTVDFPPAGPALVSTLGEYARDVLAVLRSIPVVEMREVTFTAGSVAGGIAVRVNRTTPPYAVFGPQVTTRPPSVSGPVPCEVTWVWEPDIAAGTANVRVFVVPATALTAGVEYVWRLLLVSPREA